MKPVLQIMSRDIKLSVISKALFTQKPYVTLYNKFTLSWQGINFVI
jgi:uncharacterized linocin/CFP29 family protein